MRHAVIELSEKDEETDEAAGLPPSSLHENPEKAEDTWVS
jgi:hypothetical protein